MLVILGVLYLAFHIVFYAIVLGLIVRLLFAYWRDLLVALLIGGAIMGVSVVLLVSSILILIA